MVDGEIRKYKEENVPYQLSKVRLLMTKVFARALKKEGVELTPEQVQLLGFLFENRGCTMTEIASELVVDNSAITRLVDGLEAKRFVKRTISKQDRRQRLIEITEQGEVELFKTMGLTEKYRKSIIYGFSEKEKSHFLKMLQMLYENTEKALLELEK